MTFSSEAILHSLPFLLCHGQNNVSGHGFLMPVCHSHSMSTPSFTCREAGLAEDLSPVIAEIPEFHHITRQEIRERTAGGGLLLVAEAEGRVVGFKLGYEQSPGIFYSWLGGVRPAWRGRGIARELLTLQETWVKKRGYARIRVKSMNRFPAMLHLLISAGYQICGVEAGTVPDQGPKILFEKWLVPPEA